MIHREINAVCNNNIARACGVILQNDVMMFLCIFNKIFRMNFQTASVASFL